MRANAVRALGYLLASPCHSGTAAVHEPGRSDSQDRQPEASTRGTASAPAWFQPSVQQLQEALRTGRDKVAWNACYAVGGLLRNRASTELAQEGGCLQPLLSELLSALQHSKNHKARLYSAQARIGLDCVVSTIHSGDSSYTFWTCRQEHRQQQR